MGAVHYSEITVKSALTRVNGMPYFSWSLNPYRGCARGFDREIEVKVNFAEVLRDELTRLRLRETVALGTATDPYQRCEGRYRLTRRTLEALAGSPLPLVIVTKGTLVVRDIDVLARLSRLVSVRVGFSVGTVDRELARRSEPDAPPPLSRLEAMRRLRAAGLDAGVLAAPILPGLGDDEATLDAVAAAARAHDATFFYRRPLKLEERVERVRTRHGFQEARVPEATMARPTPAPETDGPAQLRLAI